MALVGIETVKLLITILGSFGRKDAVLYLNLMRFYAIWWPLVNQKINKKENF